MTAYQELVKGYHGIEKEIPLNTNIEFIEVANYPEDCECGESNDDECSCPTPWQIKRKTQGQLIEERCGKKVPITFIGPGDPGFSNCWWRFEKDQTGLTHWKEVDNAT